MRRMALQQPDFGTRSFRTRAPSIRAFRKCALRETFMLDLMMLALGLIFFAAAVGYTYACERL
jgi:hypothetical protein